MGYYVKGVIVGFQTTKRSWGIEEEPIIRDWEGRVYTTERLKDEVKVGDLVVSGLYHDFTYIQSPEKRIKDIKESIKELEEEMKWVEAVMKEDIEPVIRYKDNINYSGGKLLSDGEIVVLSMGENNKESDIFSGMVVKVLNPNQKGIEGDVYVELEKKDFKSYDGKI